MSLMPHTRLVNPRLGTYFGIFASTFAGLVLMLLMLEQLGLPEGVLRLAMFACPLVLYAAIGLAVGTDDAGEFFASGRRVPAFFTGLGIAITACGGTLLVAGTGLFFLNGFDAWCVVLGYVAGFVAMSILIAPFFRKVGCYTVPSLLGRRFESRLVRLAAATLLAVPMLLVIAAELRFAVMTASWLTGAAPRTVGAVLLAVTVVTLVLGGMRSVSWTGTAQAIVAMLALLLPVTIVAIALTNLPLPQTSYGSVIRNLSRLEWGNGVPRPILSPLAFDLAGPGFEAIMRQFAVPYGSVGPASFMLTSLTVMAGVASAPWLLPRTGTTPGVYEARKALGWATVVLGLAALTMAGIAVFMRFSVMSELVGREPARLPGWPKMLVEMGFASLDLRASRLAVAAFAFKRDAILFSLPVAAGHPNVVLDLALAGAVAASLAAATATIAALGALLAEDAFGGLQPAPPSDRVRIAVGRVGITIAAFAGGFIAGALPFDPLRLLLWALAISGSTAFPALVLAIWWKRLSAWGALAGVVAGFVVAVVAILAGEAAWFGVHSALAGVFGIPAGFAAAILVTRVTPSPDRNVLEFVRDLRVPGGETLYDREMRLLRLKQRQRT
jgi:cation/acetate symporter